MMFSPQTIFIIGVHLIGFGVAALPFVSWAAVGSYGPPGAKLNGIFWSVGLAGLALGAAACVYALRKSERRRELWIGATFLTLLYAFLLVALDVVVGLVVEPVSISGQLDAPKAHIYGWSFEPRKRISGMDLETGENWVEQVNAEGWRDIDHARRKERPRVLLLGDSQVYGHGLKLEDSIGRQLQKMLGDELEVLQMGYSSMGTDQECLILTHEGLLWKPDHVVLVFTMANDVRENMYDVSPYGDAPKPKFDLRDGKLVQRPFVAPRLSLLRRLFGKSNICQRLRFLVIATQATANTEHRMHAVQVGAGPRPKVYSKEKFARDEQTERVQREYYEVYMKREEQSPEFRASWDVTLALLAAMRDACRDAGATFTVYANMQYPDGYQLETTLGGESRRFDAGRPFQLLRKFVIKEGMHYIDEPTEFRQGVVDGKYNFKNDGHLNPAGAARTAEFIAARLRALRQPQE